MYRVKILVGDERIYVPNVLSPIMKLELLARMLIWNVEQKGNHVSIFPVLAGSSSHPWCHTGCKISHTMGSTGGGKILYDGHDECSFS